MSVLHRDYESRSRLNLADVGAWRYAGDPSTNIWCACYAVDDGPVKTWLPGQPIPEEFKIAAIDPDWVVIAHNDSFESAIEERLLAPRHGWPLIPIERHRCTQSLALAMALPAKLETVAAALDLTNRKDVEGSRLMLAMSRPRKSRAGEVPQAIHWVDDPEKIERLIAYCGQDVEIERELFGRLPPLSDAEQELWQLDAVINRRGFAVDVELAEAAQRIVRQRREAINVELAELTGGTITSIAQVNRLGDYLKARGHQVAGVGKRSVAAVLARNPGPDVERLLRLRQEGGRSSAAKLDSLLAMANDDRIHDALRFHGASTGRWTGHGFQPHNLARAQPEDPEAAIAAVMSGELARVAAIGPPLEVIGSLSRSMITSAPGKILIAADFSSVEPRVLCWLAGESWKLDGFRKFDATGDLALENYCLVASRVLGRTVTPDDEDDRQIGKFMELAFGYGGALGAFRKIAPDAEFTDEQVEVFKRQWRSAHPKIVKFWGNLHRLLLRAVRTGKTERLNNFRAEMRDGYLYLFLPSGRAIVYPEARIEPGPFDEHQIIYKDNAKGKWTDVRGWHGTFAENVVQAISRDLLTAAMQRLEAAGYPVVLHVHDEIVCEVDAGFGSVEEFARLMTELPPWATGLPVAAKARISHRYAKEKNGKAEPDANELLDDNDAEAAPANGEDSVESADPTDNMIEASPDLAAAISSMIAGIARGEGGDHEQRANGGSGGEDRGTFGNYAHGEERAGRFVESYVYKDAGGRNYHKVDRFAPSAGKRAQFPQWVWTGNDWRKGAPKIKLPYRLPELNAAKPDVWVFICEGEKDANSVAALGLVATTSPGGAGKWTPELDRWFAGRQRVCICADNDEPGRQHAQQVAGHLRGQVADIRVMAFPELPEGGDVSDWLADHDKAALLARLDTLAQQGAAPLAWLDMSTWDDGDPPPLEWAVPFCIPREQVGLYSGVGGTGKTTCELLKNVAHVLGRPWFGMQPTPGPTIYVGSEDPEKILRIRLTTIARFYGTTFEKLIAGGLHILNLFGQDATIFFYNNKTQRLETTPLYDQIYQAAGDLKPINIALDPLARIFSGSEIDRTQVYRVVGFAQALSIASGGSVMLLSHPSMHGISSGSGLSGSTAWHDAFRSRQYLRKVKNEDADESEDADDETDNGLRELVFMKNQYGPPLAKILLRYQNGLFLPEATLDEFEKTAAAAQADKVFLELLDRLTAQGRNLSAVANSSNYAPKLFAEQGTGISRKQFEAAMQRLFNGNKIRVERYGPPSKTTTRIVRREP
jgi:DNA polymerase